MKKSIMRSVSAIITIVLIFASFATTALAATGDEYGWYWQNSRVDRKTFGLTESNFLKTDFYKDNKADYTDPDINQVASSMLSYYGREGGRSKQLKWVFYKGANLYDTTGARLRSDLKGEGPDYLGYDAKGMLYVVTSQGKLMSLKDNGTTWTTVLSSGANKLYRDDYDLVVKVGTSGGTKTLSSLTGGTSGDAVQKGVQLYMTDGGHVIFDAYRDNKVYLTVTCDNSYVYTSGYTLSEDCRGAKFVGIDSDYNVYLQDTNGKIYKFYYGKWTTVYSTTVSKSVLDFVYDDVGFFTGVKTSDGTTNLSKLSFSR